MQPEQNNVLLSCPFCEFEDHDPDFLSQHVDHCHPEDPVMLSESIATHNTWVTPAADLSAVASDQPGDVYVPCPHGCGEEITKTELQLHLDLHVAESVALDETDSRQAYHSSPNEIEARVPNSANENIGAESSRNHVEEDLPDNQDDLLFHGDDVVLKGKKTKRRRKQKQDKSAATHDSNGAFKRLGRKELGPYAHEKKMPSWLQKLLLSGEIENTQTRIGPGGALIKDKGHAENETSQVIPALAELCRHDPTVQRVFFCSPRVRHIFKFMREGGFCGYRNIQMLISHIIDARLSGHEHFSGRIPSILELQTMIEQAWDMGFNSSGRIETGGIKGTRKYIGTPEAQALFLSLGIKCIPGAFTSGPGHRAHDYLLQDVANYFKSGCPASVLEGDEKVLQTNLPPMYFQHPGHSMTIIGFEINTAGNANLLVFDPMFRTSPAIQRLIGKFIKPSDPSRILKAWRRGVPYLQKYKEFELLKLAPE